MFQIQITALANRVHDQSMREKLSGDWLQGANSVMNTLAQTMAQSLHTTGELIQDLGGKPNEFMKRGSKEFSSMHESAKLALSEVNQSLGIMGLFERLLAPNLINASVMPDTQELATLSQRYCIGQCAGCQKKPITGKSENPK